MTPESMISCRQLATIKSISGLESLEILVALLMSCLRSEYLNSDLSCWQSALLHVDDMKQQLNHRGVTLYPEQQRCPTCD